MANIAEVRAPSVKIEDGAADTAAVMWALPISSAASGCPYVRYSFHDKKDSVVQSPTAPELIKKIAAAQTKIFEPTTTKSIFLYDGKNHSSFLGFDSGPHHEVAFGGVTNGRALVHECAALQHINTSIYVSKINESQVKGAVDPGAASTIPEFIKLVLEKMIEAYDPVEDERTSGKEAAKLRLQVHTNNVKLIKTYWYKVLDNTGSDVTFDGFDKFITGENNLTNRDTLVQAIHSVYKNASSDFFTIIDQFSSMFQMMFIPDTLDDGSIGKFISYKTIVGETEDKEVNIRSIGIQPGARSMLPTTAVVMEGLPNTGPENKLLTNTSQRTIMTSWPDPIPAVGQITTVSCPAWIPSTILVSKDIQEGGDLSPEEYKSKRLDEKKATIDVTTKIFEMGKDFCRTHYTFISLENCTANIVTLLDLTWEVGKRYKVKQQGGDDILFSGFLKSIEHRISSNPSKTEATTQLLFSHVEAEGFTLPNK